MTLVLVDMTTIIEILTNKFFLEASQRTIYMEYSRACSMVAWTRILKSMDKNERVIIIFSLFTRLVYQSNWNKIAEPNKDHFSQLQSELM